MLRTHRALVLENLALRHQLAVLQRTAPRPRLRTRRPAVLGPAVPPVERLDGCHLRRPTRDGDPVAARRLHALLDLEEPPERARPSERRPGGPSADPTNVRANPLWGAPRIHGELQKLGIEIAQATVSKYLVRHRAPPSQTWRTFLDNHLRSLVSVDFFTVPTVTFKVLFVFVVLAHHRRRVVHVNVTDAPTAQWTAQQTRGGVPLGHRTAIPAARPRCGSTGPCSRAACTPGDPRSQDGASVPLAESLRVASSEAAPDQRVKVPPG